MNLLCESTAYLWNFKPQIMFQRYAVLLLIHWYRGSTHILYKSYTLVLYTPHMCYFA